MRTPDLRGRAQECDELEAALVRVRGGQSTVLVIRGEPGIGKTALLQYCARQAAGARIAQIVGVQSEMEMPFAALHQLCGPMLDRLGALPEPQARALQVAFGLATGAVPDHFLVGLAVLGLLAETAARRPLICLVDDAQWLDEASRQVLGFVGRRLLAESVLLVFAVREEGEQRLFPALKALTLEGLADEDARALLTDTISGQLDEQIRDRIVAETHGNPLGLLELPRGMSPAELAGGFAAPTVATLHGRIEDHYVKQVRALPRTVRQVLLLAAADPTCDATLLWRAARSFDIDPDTEALAGTEQLLEIGARVHFRHPLVRSAAYAAASVDDRRDAHVALAAATDAMVDPERRIWHLAAAATDPDERVAAELERSAVKAQARAGLAAAAAFLQRSLALTVEPEKRADRALAAAGANLQAGAFESAFRMLAEAEAAAVCDLRRARVEHVRGQVEWASHRGPGAPSRLLSVAARLEPLDLGLARETYAAAWLAAFAAGRFAAPGGDLTEVSRAARSAARSTIDPTPCDLLLDGLTMKVIDGLAVAEPHLRRAVAAFLDDQESNHWFQWGTVAQIAAIALWDLDTWATLSTRLVELARASGALAPLPIALSCVGMVATLRGDFEAATSRVAEEDAVREATGVGLNSYGALLLAGYRGNPDGLAAVSPRAADTRSRGVGLAWQLTGWANAVLHNGLGQYADALGAAEQATQAAEAPFITAFALPELIEAAARCGKADIAADAMRRLSGDADVTSDWAAGIVARSRAVLSEGHLAEECYLEAIDRLGRTPLAPDLARTHLLYGEWLRREKRRLEARAHLRAAADSFTAIGTDAFAERARRELLATGEKARKRSADTETDLTPQEEHIARLARDGRSNAEIGAELFISARTVEWHLRNVFAKLGVGARTELHDVLPARGNRAPQER